MERFIIYNAANQKLEQHEADQIELETLQDAVGGFFEPFRAQSFLRQGILMIVNEEGKLKQLTPSAALSYKGIVADLLVGNIMFVHQEGEDLVGLNEKQIEYVNKWFANQEQYTVPDKNGKPMKVPVIVCI